MSTSTNTEFVPTGHGDEAKATALRAHGQIMARTAPTYLRPLAVEALASIDYLDHLKGFASDLAEDHPGALAPDVLARVTDRTAGEVAMLAKVVIVSLTNERPGAIAPCDYPGLLRAVVDVAI